MKIIELGDTWIGLNQRHRIIYGREHVVFVNVHQDEETSVEAATLAIEHFGGYFYHLGSMDGGRNISFGLEDGLYVFDPNRIFTDLGRKKTIEELSRAYDWEADLEVSMLARIFIETILGCNPKLVVAVHNNKGQDYSVETYAVLEKSLSSNDAFCHVNESINPHNFFFTTERFMFNALRVMGMNVALQNPQVTQDDGSLSIFCALAGIPYVNIEAQKGHLAEQVAMIQVLLGLVEIP